MKVLVAVASRHGSTWEIARVIGDVLAARGVHTDVAYMEDVSDLAEYDGFVLGSAVYAGRWLKQAAEFMREYAPVLAGRPVWLFSSGPIGSPLRPHEAQSVDIRRIAGLVRIREHRIFAGKLKHGHLNLAEKLLTAATHAPQGDFRNWREIRSWAAGIAESLQGSAVRIAGRVSNAISLPATRAADQPGVAGGRNDIFWPL